jgi:predicted dehydrogenase
MGGGCLLDCIHEIDLARWYLGEVTQVFCAAGQLSSLELEVEDVAALICKHADGALSEIHLDYVQRTYERGCQIVGERGSIFWDYKEGCVRWFDSGKDAWNTYAQPDGWGANQMYLDELTHFLDCVRAGKTTTLPVPEALEVMRIVFAAKASIDAGALMQVKDTLL